MSRFATEPSFKRVPDGILFSPAVALLGVSLGCRIGPTYLLAEPRAAELAALSQRFNAALSGICRVYALLALAAVMFALGMLLAPGELPALPAMSRAAFLALLAVAVCTPFAVVVARFALSLRQAVRSAPRAAERITAANVFSAEVAAISLGRLKLQLATGVLLAIVSASNLIEGLIFGTLSSKGPWLFCLPLAIYFVSHSCMLLLAKRALRAR